MRSGASATEYFDKYRFESDPAPLREIAAHLAPLVPAGTEILAGLEMGGIPIVTALSAETGIPAAFVRKKAKEYGTCAAIEGRDVAGARLCVVEDVISSGGQVGLSTNDLRAADAVVYHVLCVIDRRPVSAEDVLGAAGDVVGLGEDGVLERGLVGDVGVGGGDPRRTGRRGRSKQCSAIHAATSAPKPHVRTSSCTTSTRPVRATDSATRSWSHGMIVRRSMISTGAMPSARAARPPGVTSRRWRRR